jgi:hypothetical protein
MRARPPYPMTAAEALELLTAPDIALTYVLVGERPPLWRLEKSVYSAAVVAVKPVHAAAVVTVEPIDAAAVVAVEPVDAAAVVTDEPIDAAAVVAVEPVHAAAVVAVEPVHAAAVVPGESRGSKASPHDHCARDQ